MFALDGSRILALILALLQKLVPNISDEPGVRRTYLWLCDLVAELTAKTATPLDDLTLAWLKAQATTDEPWKALYALMKAILPSDGGGVVLAATQDDVDLAEGELERLLMDLGMPEAKTVLVAKVNEQLLDTSDGKVRAIPWATIIAVALEIVRIIRDWKQG